MGSQNVVIDVVIPHYGRQALLDRCLQAIAANSGKAVNVLVHDNNRNNIGFAAAVNATVRRGDAPIIVLLNNDTAVPAGWLTTMTAVLFDDPKTAAVGPISSARTQWQGVANVESWLKVQLPCPGYVSTADGKFPANLAFWCVMIRRVVWERVGPLDEGYFIYAEDEDWCVRARRLGYHLALDLQTIAHHDHRANYDEATRGHHDDSKRRFRARWPDEHDDRHWSERLANGDIPRLPIRLPRASGDD